MNAYHDFDQIPSGTRLTFTAAYELVDGSPYPAQTFSYDMDLYKQLLRPRTEEDEMLRQVARIAAATEAMAGLNQRLTKIESDVERMRRWTGFDRRYY